jgi:hypothetical protein
MSVLAIVTKSTLELEANFLLANPVVSVRPVAVPAVVNVAVLDIEMELSIISVLANVIVAVVVAIFIYLFICLLICLSC